MHKLRHLLHYRIHFRQLVTTGRFISFVEWLLERKFGSFWAMQVKIYSPNCLFFSSFSFLTFHLYFFSYVINPIYAAVKWNKMFELFSFLNPLLTKITIFAKTNSYRTNMLFTIIVWLQSFFLTFFLPYLIAKILRLGKAKFSIKNTGVQFETTPLKNKYWLT